MGSKIEHTLILGTGSKRRIDLMNTFDLEFSQVASDFDEDQISTSLPPKEYVKKIALGKARALVGKFPNQPILTADTTVYFEKKNYGKPKDSVEAINTLKKFRNHTHQVWTGLCLAFEGNIYSEQVMTSVHFNNLTDRQIEQYVDIFNPLDKAGSYAIQDAAGLLVNRIEGDYHNVIGFPLTKVAQLLTHAGIELWNFLKKPSAS